MTRPRKARPSWRVREILDRLGPEELVGHAAWGTDGTSIERALRKLTCGAPEATGEWRARPLRWSRALSAWLAAAALTAVTSTLSAAQICPRAETGKLGFVVERGDQQKSEVYHLDNGMVRAVMRYNGSVLLEGTEYEGLFDLDIGPRRK